MILIWFLSGSIALGWWVVIFLNNTWRWWIKGALAIPLGFLITSWATFLLSLLFRSTDVGLTVVNLLLAVPVYWLLRDLLIRRNTGEAITIRLLASLLFFVPVVALYWVHTAYGNVLGGFSTHGYSWGDGPLHMTLASFFSVNARPLLELPLLPETKLTYPFLIDWQAGLLLRMGASWGIAIAIPGALLFGAASVLSVELVKRLLGTARAAGIHLALFLGMGSAAGIIPLVADYIAGRPIWTTDYSNILSQGLNLANPITSHFLPQRSFLFGFALLMAVFVIGLDLWKEKRYTFLWAPGVLLGLIPFAHAHSALVGAGWWVVISILLMINEPKTRLGLGIGLAGMIALFAPQLWWLLSEGAASTSVLKIGWMWRGEGTLLVYWVRQLGISLPLISIGLFYLRPRYCHIFLSTALIGGGVLFILGNVRLFHPSDFDNLKFMLYGFWALLLPAAYILDRLSRTKATLLTPVIVGLATIVGAHTLIRDVMPQTAYALFSREDIRAAEDMRDVLPVDALVATSERHNNVVAALAGRRVLAGYGGWLWSYGLDYLPALEAQETIVKGLDDGALVEKYGVDFIAISTDDRNSLVVSAEKLREKYRIVYTGHGWTIFTTGL